MTDIGPHAWSERVNRHGSGREIEGRVVPGHTEHTDDCMSEWGENARHVMTPETIACNHRLHLADHYEFVCSLATCGWASDDSTALCPDHGFRVPTNAGGMA